MTKTKFKCWKRTTLSGRGFVQFERNDRKEQINISLIEFRGYIKNMRKSLHDRKTPTHINWSVTLSRYPKKPLHKAFKTKSQALKFAKQYMKKHDKC